MSFSILGIAFLGALETYVSILYTPPIAKILCVKNGRTIVVFFIIKKIYTESLKKIVGAVWELPAKGQKKLTFPPKNENMNCTLLL